MRLTGNPGGPGHGWLKHRYIEPCRTGYKVITEVEEIEELSTHKNADNLPVRVDMTKKLMDTLRISIDKERQAFGITDAPTPTDDAIRDLLKGLNKNADRKSTRLNSSHSAKSRMPSSA